jgi:hypothetical protein
MESAEHKGVKCEKCGLYAEVTHINSSVGCCRRVFEHEYIYTFRLHCTYAEVARSEPPEHAQYQQCPPRRDSNSDKAMVQGVEQLQLVRGIQVRARAASLTQRELGGVR